VQGTYGTPNAVLLGAVPRRDARNPTREVTRRARYWITSLSVWEFLFGLTPPSGKAKGQCELCGLPIQKSAVAFFVGKRGIALRALKHQRLLSYSILLLYIFQQLVIRAPVAPLVIFQCPREEYNLVFCIVIGEALIRQSLFDSF
jgi:hypothetical protein